MATLKYSRQRESIKEFLMTRKDHPTADVVYENVKKNIPQHQSGNRISQPFPVIRSWRNPEIIQFWRRRSF